VASWATEPTNKTLERTLAIAENLIRQGKIEDGLSLVRQVNAVTEAETLRRFGRTAEE
jgi:hypothetical protein